jgi:hypothetical protein
VKGCIVYSWFALLRDGQTVQQFENGKEQSSEVLYGKDLSYFALLSNGQPVHIQYIDPGYRLIYRRRVQKKPECPDLVCHLVGLTKQIGEETVQHVSFVFENGPTHCIGQYQSNHPWFYPVIPVPREEQKSP